MNATLKSMCAGVGLCAAMLINAGCQSGQTAAEHPANPALRRIETPPNASQADVERAALARFVGTWDFKGWSGAPGAERSQVAGRAAGVIENGHFIMMDMQVTSGQLAGRTGRKSGTMLLASEPGLGLTLTAWGDASPSISRSTGKAEGNASAFSFRESRTPKGAGSMTLTITFQSDDHWVAEIGDAASDGNRSVARYEFSRSSP